MGSTAVFVFDTRSVRNYEASANPLISDQQFEDFREFLNRIADNGQVTDVITLTTVPFVNLRTWVEELMTRVPDLINEAILQGIRDDVRDGWASPNNFSTFQAVIREISAFMRRRTDVQVWNVSGDIHVANAFMIVPEGLNRPIFQITTSALTNRSAPPAIIREITEIEDELTVDGIGAVYRIWPTVADPNFLCIQSNNGRTKFALKSFDYEKSEEHELVVSP